LTPTHQHTNKKTISHDQRKIRKIPFLCEKRKTASKGWQKTTASQAGMQQKWERQNEWNDY